MKHPMVRTVTLATASVAGLAAGVNGCQHLPPADESAPTVTTEQNHGPVSKTISDAENTASEIIDTVKRGAQIVVRVGGPAAVAAGAAALTGAATEKGVEVQQSWVAARKKEDERAEGSQIAL